MTDARMLASNGRVALRTLEGKVEAQAFVHGQKMMVQQPIVSLTDKPRGRRVSQLVFGEAFLVLETREGFAFGCTGRDGYVGYILASALMVPAEPTHWVTAPATHLYPKASVKAVPDTSIYFASRVQVRAEHGNFLRIHTGHFVPQAHLQPIKVRFADHVGVADLFLGTPYLWGGISRWGIDCSGLVQTSLLACGVDCPRDSDQQQATLGRELPSGEPLGRGDLVFWKGHVGIMADEQTLLHANAHHMSVAYEPLRDAAARLEAYGDGTISARRRLLGKTREPLGDRYPRDPQTP
ncbi:MAG: C40 family peptidase [Rhodobacteraceae bacterium]|nr:C40 family peptidase [Paracoccaceae bacterium]